MDTESLKSQLKLTKQSLNSQGVRLWCQDAYSAEGTAWHMLSDNVVPSQAQEDLTNAYHVLSRVTRYMVIEY